MEEGSEKIESILEKLRKSKPVMANSDEFTENVIRKLQKERTAISPAELIYEFMFGWVYVGWMRRIMVAVAAIVVLFFGYQQAVILKRIDALSQKAYYEGGMIKTGLTRQLAGNIKKYRFSGKNPITGAMNISEKEIEKFIKSLNEIQVRYNDVFELIENDPQLKKYVEARINKLDKTKPKM